MSVLKRLRSLHLKIDLDLDNGNWMFECLSQIESSLELVSFRLGVTSPLDVEDLDWAYLLKILTLPAYSKLRMLRFAVRPDRLSLLKEDEGIIRAKLSSCADTGISIQFDPSDNLPWQAIWE